MAHTPYVVAVTLTNGSTTVTATPAIFLAAVKPGDWLRAPDEKMYFVDAVVSNNEITLDRVYLGATTTETVSIARHSEAWGIVADAAARLARIEEALARGYTLTSNTATTVVGSGAITLTVEAGLNFLPGIRMTVASRSDLDDVWMSGIVTAYSGSSMTIDVDSSEGSGSHADWNINIAGTQGPTGGTFLTTTKGTIPVGNGSSVVGLPVGTDGYVPSADSSQSTGWIWVPRRKLITANTTLYVRADGNDANNGLTNTAGGAKATRQGAWDALAAMDLGARSATIQVGSGTWTDTLDMTSMPVGGSSITWRGDPTTPSNVFLNLTSTAFKVSAPLPCLMYVNGFKIAHTGAELSGVYMAAPGTVNAQNIEAAGGTTGYIGFFDVHAPGATIIVASGHSITGSMSAYFSAIGGVIRTYNQTITLTGTPAFSWAFAVAQQFANLNVAGVTWSGAATGKRHDISRFGLCQTGGAGTGYFPGSTAGSVDATSSFI